MSQIVSDQFTANQEQQESFSSLVATHEQEIAEMLDAAKKKEAMMQRQIAELKEQNATLFEYNMSLNDANTRLSSEKRLETHVLSHHQQDRINAAFLKSELQRLKGERMAHILKHEKQHKMLDELRNELEQTKIVLSKSKQSEKKFVAEKDIE